MSFAHIKLALDPSPYFTLELAAAKKLVYPLARRRAAEARSPSGNADFADECHAVNKRKASASAGALLRGRRNFDRGVRFGRRLRKAPGAAQQGEGDRDGVSETRLTPL
jgi:hypothetical protein